MEALLRNLGYILGLIYSANKIYKEIIKPYLNKRKKKRNLKRKL